MMTNSTLAEIAAVLKPLQRVLVVSHYNPDADALGATLGLGLALQQAGKTVEMINETVVNERYRFLPGVEKIRNAVPAGEWQAAIVCDCGELKRIGDALGASFQNFRPLINIDHHATNDHFGQYNYVIPEACSSAELVLRVLKAMALPPSAQVATCLFAGISGDTGSFRYSSTVESTFEIARELVHAGASPNFVADALHGSKPVEQLKLEALALSAMTLHCDGRVAEVVVLPDMYKQCQAGPEDTENLVEIARDIKGVQIAIMIRWDKDLWKVSLRTKAGGPDMSLLAAGFGGGGHKAAAAFRWRKALADLRQALMAEVKKGLGLK